jgi:hypothetical protein
MSLEREERGPSIGPVLHQLPERGFAPSASSPPPPASPSAERAFEPSKSDLRGGLKDRVTEQTAAVVRAAGAAVLLGRRHEIFVEIDFEQTSAALTALLLTFQSDSCTGHRAQGTQHTAHTRSGPVQSAGCRQGACRHACSHTVRFLSEKEEIIAAVACDLPIGPSRRVEHELPGALRVLRALRHSVFGQ